LIDILLINENERKKINMKTSIIGYPRIGCLRELKFSLEKYFKNEASVEELQNTAFELRKKNWKIQQQNEIDFIPSNDFSFYDNFLDTAFLLNIIPKRYKELGLSKLDTYFAMARGYQGEKGDVKALAMKKWFNTNYHYIVPEIDDDTEIKLIGTKPFDEYIEAKNMEIDTCPVIIGAFTLLKQLKFTGSKCINDFKYDIKKAYTQILSRFSDIGAEWVQISEPYLVRDLTSEDIELFQYLYSDISKKNVKLLLQTYFGDIRDCYNKVVSMPFDAIGLDFKEGKKSIELVKRNGFPKDKLLFAGVINGKNIWKNNYRETLGIIENIKENCENVVLNTSCSLLHVPYTLKNEVKLGDEYKKYFSFAEEKLAELKELKKIIAEGKSTEEYINNERIFATARSCEDKAVQDRVKSIKKEDFVRLPKFDDREKIQKEKLKLPDFPTTTIGSFPQISTVKGNRSAYKKGNISKSEYIDFNKKKIKECIDLQNNLELDVLVHGEYERNDMVEYFGENLKGYLFTEKAWVQSYGTRCVKPPVVWGDISREKAMTVNWSVYAQSLTDKPVKGMLTGPVTILNWSFPREDISLRECAYQIALAVRDEVQDLEANGIKIIQIDEAALREKLPLRKSDWKEEYLDWAIPAFRLVHSGVKAETQIHTHMCYSEFTDIIKDIDDMDADVITFEASRSNLDILDAIKENNFHTEVGPGVYDIHSARVPSVEEIKQALYKMLEKISLDKLWVNPDCGLKTRGEAETVASLENMVKAAKQLRVEV
jgi:5-methyltetrahydropteroyltriglutamate--homocysteine methyltransferase